MPERDIVTPTGKKLPSMNPAYMLRQLMEFHTGNQSRGKPTKVKEPLTHTELYGIKGRITLLKALNP